MYLKNMSPKINNAKIKEEVFVGPQLREIIQDVTFEDQLSELETAARKSFKNVIASFWGNRTTENYRYMVAVLVQFYKAMECDMS
jgi:predicted nucleic acid-binding OB-fold protein